jgi:flagellar biosynthetic protein FliQ
MDVDIAAELGREALLITLLISMPAMLTGMIVGLAISIFQSVTSIQEQTLSFVPKIIVTLVVTLVALPWIATQLMEYTVDLYLSIPMRF